MLLIGSGVFLAGYALAYFGWESLRGPGVGLLDLIIPGRFKGHSGPGVKPTTPSGVTGGSGFAPGAGAGGGAAGGGGRSW